MIYLRFLFSSCFFISSIIQLQGQPFSSGKTRMEEFQKRGITGYSSINIISNIDGRTPFWFYSNTSGIIRQSRESEQYWISEFQFPVKLCENLFLRTGAELVVQGIGKKCYINQLYTNLYYRNLQLRLGKEAFTIGQYNDELSSGSMFLSKNSPPVPRIGIGFYEYTPLPFTNTVLFKGAFQLGLLDDNRGEKGTKNPWLQEKFFYLKTANRNFNIWLGMNHSVLMGGIYPDGREIPLDFWASFLGRGSDKFNKNFLGEKMNAAGAHFGLFDFGSECNFKNWHFDIWYQKPISDLSGLRGVFNWEHDKVLGLNLISSSKSFLNQILFEYIKTDYQSGEGTPDLAMNGKILDINKIEDYSDFLIENFGVEVENISNEEFESYLYEFLNNGEKPGGRDDYYNNGLYYRGNSYQGHSLGTPLFLTQNDLSFISNIEELPCDRFFINNRVVAYHLGVSGWISKRIKYRLKETYTVNYGTYSGRYGGNFLWNEQFGYFFKNSKEQNYLLLEINYYLLTIPADFLFAIGWDKGQLFNSTALKIAVKWKI